MTPIAGYDEQKGPKETKAVGDRSFVFLDLMFKVLWNTSILAAIRTTKEVITTVASEKVANAARDFIEEREFVRYQ